MTSLVIIVTIIGIAVVFEGLLLVGLLRAYRRLGAAPAATLPVSPRSGQRISSEGLPSVLAERVSELQDDLQVLGMLTTSCVACERALETLARERRFTVPITLIVGEYGEWPAGMRESVSKLSTEVAVITTDAPLDALSGLGPPEGFPTFVVLSHGVVIHSTYAPLDALSFASQLSRV